MYIALNAFLFASIYCKCVMKNEHFNKLSPERRMQHENENEVSEIEMEHK